MKLLDELNKSHKGWLEWEPETIRAIVLKEEEDDIKFNKIMALQTILNTQSDDDGVFLNDWQIFEKIVLSLNGIVPDFSEIEEVEPHEIYFVYKLIEDIKNKVEFNDEVAKYIAASYMTNNIVYCHFYDKVNKYLRNTTLAKDVKDKLKKIPLDNDEIIEKIANLDDDEVTVQIKRIIYIDQYSKNRKEE